MVELEGKRPLGRPRRRCVNNISWITRRCGVGIWIELVCPGSSQIADACEGCNETSGSVKFGVFLD